MRSRATRISSGGISIGLREWGEGPPVLLVHGTGLTSRYWSPLAAMLAERFRATTVDLLGYGETSLWEGGDAFHFHADRDVVIAALEHAGEPSHVVGHSYGGLLALQAALARPDLVRSLALYEPVAFSVLHSAHHRAGLEDLNREGRGETMMNLATGGDEAWLRMFVDYWNGAGAFDNMTQLARAGLLATGRKAFLEVRSNLLDRTTHDDYAKIAAPTLLLCGADSPMAAKATVEVLAGAMPNAERKVIEGAGHLGPFTHGDAVGRAILSLLVS
ncbi:MAG: alpha/beta hydrolase [Polyangiaceae bacterium]|nr:alpha/beta hydrolase [Polyangiaceae bacterium]